MAMKGLLLIPQKLQHHWKLQHQIVLESIYRDHSFWGDLKPFAEVAVGVFYSPQPDWAMKGMKSPIFFSYEIKKTLLQFLFTKNGLRQWNKTTNVWTCPLKREKNQKTWFDLLWRTSVLLLDILKKSLSSNLRNIFSFLFYPFIKTSLITLETTFSRASWKKREINAQNLCPTHTPTQTCTQWTRNLLTYMYIHVQ